MIESAVQNAIACIGWNDSQSLIAHINTMCRDERLAFAGIGKSHHVAQLAACTFASLGIPSLQLDTAHIVHGDSGFIRGSDTVIFISKSGRTTEMLDAMRCIKRTSPCAHIYLLTCAQEHELHGEADLHDVNIVSLPFGSVQELNGYSPTTSTVAFVAYLMQLAHECQVFDECEFRAHHPGGTIGQGA